MAASWTVVNGRLARWKVGFDDAFALAAGGRRVCGRPAGSADALPAQFAQYF